MTGRAFGADEIRRLQDFANQAAVALEKARLFALETSRREQLEALATVQRDLSAELDLDRLLGLIVERAGRLFEGAGFAYLFDEDSQSLGRVWGRAEPESEAPFPAAGGMVANCASERRGAARQRLPEFALRAPGGGPPRGAPRDGAAAREPRPAPGRAGGGPAHGRPVPARGLRGLRGSRGAGRGRGRERDPLRRSGSAAARGGGVGRAGPLAEHRAGRVHRPAARGGRRQGAVPVRSHQRGPPRDRERLHRHAEPSRRVPGRVGAPGGRAGLRRGRARARVGPPVPQRQHGGGPADHASPRRHRRARGSRGHPGGADHGGGPRRGAALRAPAHREAVQRPHRDRPAPARGVRGHRHPQHAHAGPRAPDARGGGEREPDQGRVPGHPVARAAQPAPAPAQLGLPAALAQSRAGERGARARRHRAEHQDARPAHRGSPRRVAHRHREAAAAGPPGAPARGGARGDGGGGAGRARQER